MRNPRFSIYDEEVDRLSQRLEAFSISDNSQDDCVMGNEISDDVMEDSDLSKSTKKRCYKSMDDLLNACFNFTDTIRSLYTKNKDLSEYIVDNPKYQSYLKDCRAVRFTGYIDFKQRMTNSKLSKMGYEAGERCILLFFGFPSGKNDEPVMLLKSFANICYIKLNDDSLNKNEITLEFERNVGGPEDEEELKNLLNETSVVKIFLDPDNGVYFDTLNDMCTFLEPLWKTDLGKTLQTLLVDGYYHNNKVYKDSDYTHHWLASAIGLNEGQNNALILVEDRHPICFIQSPPGTGKTSTASSIVLANPQYKYLVTAESNKGCDAIADSIEKMKTFAAHNPCYQSLYSNNARKVCPVRIYSTTVKYKKKNQSNYCESKLKFSKEFTSSDKLTPTDFNVLTEYNRISKIVEERKSRHLTFNELSRFRKKLATLEDKRSKIFMRTYDPNIFIITTNYAIKYFRNNYGDCHYPDVVIVDEAGQMSLFSFILLAASFPKSKFVLFGDTKQLPPYIPMEYTPGEGCKILTTSIIEFLDCMNETPKAELSLSYRMHPHLLSLVSSTFYEGKLFTDIPEAMRSIVTTRLNMPNNCPIAWFDTKGYNHRSDMKTSTSNDTEAFFTSTFICNLLDFGYKPSQIGVICMYKAQVSNLCSIIKNENITIDTVDAFQGNERDIIVICTSKTAKDASDVCSNFLGDSRRINVAISRARCGLFIFGDIEFLSRNASWNPVTNFFRRSGAVDYSYNMKYLFGK
uniref:Regulator of nonsense transcripts 1 (inferred by orthology to a human protein) n=1 Tax=Strongyloides venezuelensis TaxID=75913 RepID=A0A0K0F3V3_STRVS